MVTNDTSRFMDHQEGTRAPSSTLLYLVDLPWGRALRQFHDLRHRVGGPESIAMNSAKPSLLMRISRASISTSSAARTAASRTKSVRDRHASRRRDQSLRCPIFQRLCIGWHHSRLRRNGLSQGGARGCCRSEESRFRSQTIVTTMPATGSMTPIVKNEVSCDLVGHPAEVHAEKAGQGGKRQKDQDRMVSR